MRWRILGSIMIPVTVIVSVMLLSVSSLVISNQTIEIDSHLAREAQELRLLAENGSDPNTGLAFESSRDLLQLYISRTIPDPNETMFVLENGLVFSRTTDVPAVRLDQDPEFLEIVNGINSSQFGNYPTNQGNARFLVVPVVNGGTNGALVAIIFSDIEKAPILELLLRFGLIAIFALAATGAIGYLVAGRLFRPIESLTRLAGEIAGESLGRRIPVPAIHSELDQLALEFNSMLDRLESAFKSQKQFLDIAGHELRTPLTIIRGHFDLIQADPKEAAASMPIIQDELSRMSRLVQDLQALTRASAPGFINKETVDLQDLSIELRSKSATLTERKLEVISATGKWRLDRQRVSQAVLQLVENALKYTPSKARIRISLQALENNLLIEVEDSGSGVPEENQKDIWNPFVRGKNTQNVEGSGLGLSLVKAITEAHGGTVDYSESELGGARFEMRFPR